MAKAPSPMDMLSCGIPQALMNEVHSRRQCEELNLRDFVADALRLRLGLSMEAAARVRIAAERYGVDVAEYLSAAIDQYDPAKSQLKQTRGKRKGTK